MISNVLHKTQSKNLLKTSKKCLHKDSLPINRRLVFYFVFTLTYKLTLIIQFAIVFKNIHIQKAHLFLFHS